MHGSALRGTPAGGQPTGSRPETCTLPASGWRSLPVLYI